MTWPQICEELIRRWPEKFHTRYPSAFPMRPEFGTLFIGVNFGPEQHDAVEYNPYSIDFINNICTAIGAVVFSSPVVPQCEYWRAMYYCTSVPEHEYYGGIYPTRAEAELAALGAWLEATR